ncbi:MAG: sugar phosphate isomerase/epimerase family protein [Ilumatobacteraceae bacterium]
MKLGLLTAPFEGTDLLDVADWASANRYEMLEVACWPSGEGATRRYGGVCHIDVDGMTADRAHDTVSALAERGVTISGLGYYPNPLQSDDAARVAIAAHLRSVIDAAELMEVPVVNTFMGADQRLTLEQNWAEAKTFWPEIVAHARDKDVKIAIENCPMIFSNDEWPSGQNLAYSPAMWRRIFEEFGETVGLNFDPSHLVWQHIDMPRAIAEFGGRFYHAHAKDLMIDHDGLYDHGIMSLGMGWQVPRLPGLGDVDWRAFFSALYRVGYDYVCCVEHEDRQWEGSDELLKRGFLLARDVLEPYIH